jgi:GNAT superfamily N-acetyltransferase
MTTTTGVRPTAATLVLAAGDPPVLVRPMTAADEVTVRAVFDGMSPESRRMRFLTGVPRLTDGMLRLLTAVDHERHGAWVVEVEGSPVAIGRWVRLSDPDEADISLAVVDAWQGRGIGRALLDLIGVAAAEAGVSTLVWAADAENRRVLRLLADLPGTRRTSDGVVEGRTTLPSGRGVDVVGVRRLAAQARHAYRQARDVAA